LYAASRWVLSVGDLVAALPRCGDRRGIADIAVIARHRYCRHLNTRIRPDLRDCSKALPDPGRVSAAGVQDLLGLNLAPKLNTRDISIPSWNKCTVPPAIQVCIGV
jgi:hypothetical protein